MRRIETDGGTLVGNVDRIASCVVWHLECPECETLIPLDDDRFNGRRMTVCECGWKTRPTGTLAESGPFGIHVYFDFATDAFNGGGPVASGVEPGITREMRL